MASVTSSSDSEDDEEKRKLSQALDPDFLKRTASHFNQTSGDVKNSISNPNSAGEGTPISKRSKIFDTRVDIEFAKPYSLDVTPECQKFIAKQLSKSLERSLKEISPSIEPSTNGVDSGIKLFATSQTRVTENDLKPSRVPQIKPAKRKHKKKKSSKSKASDDSSSDSETEKLKSVAVSADWVMSSS